MADVVVVGAGLAGVRTCAELRAAGFAGSVLVLGAEPDPPYDRPPLTKDPNADVDLRSAMGLDVWALADEVRLGVRVERAERHHERDRAAQDQPHCDPGWRLTCSDGSELTAGTVVVATGADPVLPTGWDRPGVHVLHTWAAAGAFWSRIGVGTRLVVVGGGWVGCEAAATAAARGAQVLLFEAAPRLLAGRVPVEVSARVARWLTSAGIGLRLREPVRTLTAPADGSSLEALGSGADLVLAALGVRPATDWLVGAQAARGGDGSLLVDPVGRSAIPGLFAVGDAAARWSDRAGAHRPGGHWTEALNAPSVLAPVLAAWASSERDQSRWRADPDVPGEPGQLAPDPIPYVFSDIAGRRLLTLGDAVAGRVVWRESTQATDVRSGSPAPTPGSEAWTAFSLDDGDHLLGLCTVGRPRDLAAARRAMLADPRGTPPVDADALADPDAAPAAMFLGQG